MSEIWKDIDGFEDYQISNTGRVFSFKRSKLLVPAINKHGYQYLCLMRNSKQHTIKPHRLVAIHFIENPENLKEINHKDGNKLNNNDWNLEWSTRSKNIGHAFKTGLRNHNGSNHPRAKLTEKEIIEIRKLSTEIPAIEIKKRFNLRDNHYNDIIAKRIWKHV